jgi:hypothetical protein
MFLQLNCRSKAFGSGKVRLGASVAREAGRERPVFAAGSFSGRDDADGGGGMMLLSRWRESERYRTLSLIEGLA